MKNAENITIRHAELADVETIAAVEAICFPAAETAGTRLVLEKIGLSVKSA